MKDLCEWETSLQIKDSAHAEKPIQLARCTQASYTWNTYYSPNSAIKGWWIPRFPDSWKAAFGPKLFQMLIDWHIEAHKKASQEKLNEEFATSVKEYNACQPKQKSQRAQQPSKDSEGLAHEYTTVRHIDLEDGNEYEERVKKRIYLRKSRWGIP